jgi:hypothetical protein
MRYNMKIWRTPMTLDDQLRGEILRQVKAAPGPLDDVVVQGRSDAEIDYHIQDMIASNLLRGVAVPSKQRPGKYFQLTMTNGGQRFLDHCP